VGKIEKKIVLIDGEQLTQLMIDHRIGVTEVSSYVVSRVDSDYFEEG
jgi:restriction system protein